MHVLNAEVSVVATTGETLVRIVEKDVGRKAQRCISPISFLDMTEELRGEARAKRSPS